MSRHLHIFKLLETSDLLAPNYICGIKIIELDIGVQRKAKGQDRTMNSSNPGRWSIYLYFVFTVWLDARVYSASI